MISNSLSMEEFYEQMVYTECPYDYHCENCWFDCGDDIDDY